MIHSSKYASTAARQGSMRSQARLSRAEGVYVQHTQTRIEAKGRGCEPCTWKEL